MSPAAGCAGVRQRCALPCYGHSAAYPVAGCTGGAGMICQETTLRLPAIKIAPDGPVADRPPTRTGTAASTQVDARRNACPARRQSPAEARQACAFLPPDNSCLNLCTGIRVGALAARPYETVRCPGQRDFNARRLALPGAAAQQCRARSVQGCRWGRSGGAPFPGGRPGIW